MEASLVRPWMFQHTVCVCVLSHVRPSVTPWAVAHQNFLCPQNFPDKNTGVGCHFLLQGIFSTQGSNPCFLHWQAVSLQLSHLGSPNPKSPTTPKITGLLHPRFRILKNTISFIMTYFKYLKNNVMKTNVLTTQF